MMTRFRRVAGRGVLSACAVLCAGSLFAGSAQALDLMAAYRLAVDGDATFLAARATADAAREALPQARAGLLPQLSISASESRNNTARTSPDFLGQEATSRYDYWGKSAAVNLRQPLFRLGNVANYFQAGARVASAEATLEKDTQALALRVATAYFDVLLAGEKLASIRTQKEAYAGQLAAAERALRTGFGTRTDIDDARARLDLAAAQEIEARHRVGVTERTLAGIVNQRVGAAALARIAPERLALALPQPDDLEAWIVRAAENNPELRALQANIEVAQREVDKGRAAHLPTLDLVASRSKSDSDSNNTIGTLYWTSSLGVQLNIPLYAGGQVNSTVRQALANLENARQQYEAGRRQLEVEMEKAFGSVAQGVVRVRAHEQAVRSAEQALLSSRKGVQAGTRNSVDVLNALQQLAGARFELVQARLDYALGRLKIKQIAGQLGEADVAEVNGWLGADTAAAGG